MNKKLGLLVVGTTLMLLSACSSSANMDTVKAQKLLKAGLNNLKVEHSYISYEVDTHRLNDTFIETEVTVREPQVIEGDKYSTDYNNRFTYLYPYSVETKGDMEANSPTKVVDYTGKEAIEYLLFDEGAGLTQYQTKEKKKKDTLLDKSEVSSLLDELDKLDGRPSDFEIETYTGSDFYLQTLPSKIENLKIKETKMVNKREVTVLNGSIKGNKEESFFLYEAAEVEIWVETESKKIVREIYRDTNIYDKETGVGQTMFIYTYGKSLDDLKSIEEIENKVKEAAKLFNDDQEQTEGNRKTKENYLKKSGIQDIVDSKNEENEKREGE